jgi:hypothetical protein
MELHTNLSFSVADANIAADEDTDYGSDFSEEALDIISDNQSYTLSTADAEPGKHISAAKNTTGSNEAAVSAYSTLPSLDSAQTPDLHAGTSFSMAGATLDEEDEGDRDFRAASPKKQKRELGWKVGGRRLRTIRRAEELGFLCCFAYMYDHADYLLRVRDRVGYIELGALYWTWMEMGNGTGLVVIFAVRSSIISSR